MSKTVLVIAYYFPPIGGSGVQRMAKLVKYLPSLGYEVIVLTVKPVNYPAYDETLLAELPNSVKIFRSGSTDPARLARWFDLSQFSGNKIKSFLKNKGGLWPDSKIGWKNAAIRLGQQIIRSHEVNLILSSSPPITGHLVAMALKDRFGIPWVADFRDIWESRAPEKLYSDSIRVEKSNQLLQDIAASADAIVAVNDTIGARMSAKYMTIPGGYDPDDFVGFSTRQNVSGKFTLCYLGGIGDLHPIEPFFEAAAMASAEEKSFSEKVFFKIIGANDARKINKAADSHGLSGKVELIGYQPHRDAIGHAWNTEALLISLPSGYPEILPGKIFDCLALPAPILAAVPRGGEAEKIIETYHGGLCAESGNVGQLAEHMLHLFRKREQGLFWEKKDISSFTRREAAVTFVSLFDSVLG